MRTRLSFIFPIIGLILCIIVIGSSLYLVAKNPVKIKSVAGDLVLAIVFIVFFSYLLYLQSSRRQ